MSWSRKLKKIILEKSEIIKGTLKVAANLLPASNTWSTILEHTVDAVVGGISESEEKHVEEKLKNLGISNVEHLINEILENFEHYQKNILEKIEPVYNQISALGFKQNRVIELTIENIESNQVLHEEIKKQYEVFKSLLIKHHKENMGAHRYTHDALDEIKNIVISSASPMKKRFNLTIDIDKGKKLLLCGKIHEAKCTFENIYNFANSDSEVSIFLAISELKLVKLRSLSMKKVKKIENLILHSLNNNRFRGLSLFLLGWIGIDFYEFKGLGRANPSLIEIQEQLITCSIPKNHVEFLRLFDISAYVKEELVGSDSF